MKIIYIHQYFKTPQEGGAIRSYHLAKALIAKGFEVEMISSHNQKSYQKTNIEGIQVHYLPVFYDNKLGFLGRIVAFLHFMWRAFHLAKKIKNADYCFATSTPLTVGLIAYWLKKTKKIPYFFEVRDLWPQAPIELGFIRNFLLKKILFHWEKKIYQQADKIIALSPIMQAYIQNKVPEKEIWMIPNMADIEFFDIQPTSPKQTSNLIETNKSICAYFGTIGIANHLEYLLEIAHFFQEKKEDSLLFVIIGEGARKPYLQKLAEKKHLKNLIFLPAMDKQGIKNLLMQSDFVYISFWNKKVLESNSPNKFFDTIAAGKLCIVNSNGWIRDLVEQNQCGFYAHPEQPEIFYENIKSFLQNPTLLKSYQANAKNLAKRIFSKEILCEQFVELFEK